MKEAHHNIYSRTAEVAAYFVIAVALVALLLWAASRSAPSEDFPLRGVWLVVSTPLLLGYILRPGRIAPRRIVFWVFIVVSAGAHVALTITIFRLVPNVTVLELAFVGFLETIGLSTAAVIVARKAASNREI